MYIYKWGIGGYEKSPRRFKMRERKVPLHSPVLIYIKWCIWGNEKTLTEAVQNKKGKFTPAHPSLNVYKSSV